MEDDKKEPEKTEEEKLQEVNSDAGNTGKNDLFANKGEVKESDGYTEKPGAKNPNDWGKVNEGTEEEGKR